MATRTLSSSGNFDALVRDVLSICVEVVGATGGTIYLHEPAMNRLRFEHVLPESVRTTLPSLDIPDDFGIAGAAFQGRETVRREFSPKPVEEWSEFERATGVEILSFLATPLMLEGQSPIGIVQLLNKRDGAFTNEDAAVMNTIASISTMAYMNYRLTEESSRASMLLGMGKVGHDIGNLAASLYAGVAYTDFAVQKLREGEVAPEVVVADLEPAIAELKVSVERVVGYSRLMSDLSAGRELRPEKKRLRLAETIRSAAAFLETESRGRNVQLFVELDDEAPLFDHDPLYIGRIVQNLAGNAIKAANEAKSDEKDGQSVWLRYWFEDGEHVLEVQDSGPGMSDATIHKIYEGTIGSKWGKASGSGWGTKIVLELASAHEGSVDISSEVGEGSTFRVRFTHKDSAN